MRIGIVSPYSVERPGGVQGHVWGLGEYLVGRGHAVDVLAPGVPAPEFHARPQPSFTSAGSAWALPWNGSVARVKHTPATAVVAREWLRRGNFDVVHVHEPLTPSIAWQVLGRSHAPVVATVHTAREDVRLHVAAGNLVRERLSRIAAVVAVSETAAALARTYLRQPVEILPNGVWTSDFATGPVASPWRGGVRPRVTFLGRDEPRKGLDVLLAAASSILVQADAEIVVAGAGARRLPGHVRPLDVRDDAARARLLAATDVFVAPATGGESFGIVLLEALASGCQVAASDLPPFRAVLGEAGFTFAAGSPHALAAAVVGALERPLPPAVLAERAAAFDWSRVGADVEAVYTRAVAGR